jgi:acetyltransferase-like isoleucine patch superfamily enzyme
MSDPRDILLIGAGGHARACIDMFEVAGFYIVGLVARPEEIGRRVIGYPVLGADADLPALRAHVSRHPSVGEGSIVNSQALVEHDALLGDFGHLSTRALLNGGVSVGERCFVGSGSVVRQGLVIGSDPFIAMGSVVRDPLASGSRMRGRH